MTTEHSPSSAGRIIESLFRFSGLIRYVAIYHNDVLYTKQRSTEEINGASSSESDRYEELLVNPALLKLASQRGNIDCGGLDYLLVKYGNFYQLVYPVPDGHISICLDSQADVTKLPYQIIHHINALTDAD